MGACKRREGRLRRRLKWRSRKNMHTRKSSRTEGKLKQRRSARGGVSANLWAGCCCLCALAITRLRPLVFSGDRTNIRRAFLVNNRPKHHPWSRSHVPLCQNSNNCQQTRHATLPPTTVIPSCAFECDPYIGVSTKLHSIRNTLPTQRAGRRLVALVTQTWTIL